MGDFERGPSRYDNAVFSAFRQLEISVAERTGIKVQGKHLFYAAMGAPKSGERGPLTPEPMDAGEANAIKELFAGAYGWFRNPPGHRAVGHDDPKQTMRILVMASALMQILDEIAPAPKT